MAPHSSTLAWKIPWTEEPGGLQSMGLWRVGHDWATSLSLFTFMHWRRQWQPTPVFLPGESQGRGSLMGCRLWGRTVGHDWSDLAPVVFTSDSWDTSCPVCCISWLFLLYCFPLQFVIFSVDRSSLGVCCFCLWEAYIFWLWKCPWRQFMRERFVILHYF